MFEPVAIVGRGCVLPGALSPQALWDAVATGRDLVSSAPAGFWGLDHAAVLSRQVNLPDRSCTDRGGYVSGFGQVFEPYGFLVPPARILPLDPLFQWLLHAARQALREAGIPSLVGCRAGVVIGNLSYPSHTSTRFAETVWLGEARDRPAAENRFTSGYPAHLVATALGASGEAFALDAACASSLYAIKLACDRLHDREADVMLAGAVNRADDLFLHVGFTALQALSPSGRSRPFHRDADGLLPAEGTAFVVLKRLADAEAAGDRILGVVRGVGLSNDGGRRGFLAPDADGQVRAMRAAYGQSGLSPREISLVECHATGTSLGDAVEIRSMAAVFRDADSIPIGSLKSNLGHLITASGLAGLLKVLGAIEAGLRPPTLHAEAPTDALDHTPFRLLSEPEPWTCPGPRRAAISSFGFGGNNAHLIVEEWQPGSHALRPSAPAPAEPVAICGIGIIAGEASGMAAFAGELMYGSKPGPRPTRTLEIPLEGLRFPPGDLARGLPQQVAILAAAVEAVRDAGSVEGARAGVLVGMQCDAEIARSGLRWRLPWLLDPDAREPEDDWIAEARDAIVSSLDAARVVGTMPNIAANRLNAQFDCRGFGFTVSSEEFSGLVALRLAARALAHGEIDVALVGAVDLCCEPVHGAAAAIVLPGSVPGDAAVAFVLRRLADARREGHRIYAVLNDSPDLDRGAHADFEMANGESAMTRRFGHPHAASGMLHLAAAAVSLAARALPPERGRAPVPWLSGESARTTRVAITSFSGHRADLGLMEGSDVAVLVEGIPFLRIVSGADRQAVRRNLERGLEAETGPACMALVATDQAELEERTAQALTLLSTEPDPGRPVLAEGIWFRERPIAGELAFVFTGAAAAYPGMGRELFLVIPELGERLVAHFPTLASVAEQVFDCGPDARFSPFGQLKGSALLCQAHAELSATLLGLRPSAALGLSSGETNALFAFGAWRDMGAMFAEIDASEMYGVHLTGRCAAAAAAWGLPASSTVAWRNWRVLAPREAVEAAMTGEDRVAITIVQAPEDCVIAGEEPACRRVVERIGAGRAIDLGHDMVVHCAELLPFAEAWRRIHTRRTWPVEGVRFYSNATGAHYRPDGEGAAEALLRQAIQPIDFCRTVETAWRDGVRIFIEHGPRGILSGAIDQILAGREHLAVALDRVGRPPLRQIVEVVAQLAVAGVPVDHRRLRERLDAARRARLHRPASGEEGARVLRLDAHLPAIRLPDRRLPEPVPESLTIGQVMAPAPMLAPVGDAPPVRLWFPPASPGGGPHLPAHVAAVSSMAAIPDRVEPSDPVSRILACTAALHRAHIEQQAAIYRRFLALQEESWRLLAARVVHTNGATPPTMPGARDGDAASRPFSRAELEMLASGRISDVFGPLFAGQDDYARQVRLPEPPLLLVDRVTGLKGEPRGMGTGTIWTETDVTERSWYLHHGAMPPGIAIECGQADLLLISWLGIDFRNRGERVYRLLGCELTFHEGGLPRPGDTLRYAIHVDGHARHGDVRLFFFRYDCRISERLALSVRNGQAGFFNEDELHASGGVLWRPEDDAPAPDARIEPLPRCSRHRSFGRDRVRAFVEGDAWACFGEGFEMAAAHRRTPTIPAGRMQLIETIPVFEPAGGPWGRGYLRAEAEVPIDAWFYRGHFKNDPCMPGTLMADASVQAIAFHMAACGFTLDKDGWRFEPVPGETCKFVCRGQVVPDRPHRLTYEVFVEEVVGGPQPAVFAAVLCTCDGLKVFHCRRFGLRLVPEWPYQALTPQQIPHFVHSDVRGDLPALLACAYGRPSDAFGAMYARFDGASRVPRLPGPPYHCISRIAGLDCPPGVPTPGGSVEAEYEVPSDAWYFDDNGARAMPFSILLEALLQPCGWLASYMGFALSTERTVAFRNLDGDSAVLQAEVGPEAGRLRTRATLTRYSRVGEIILVFFKVESFLGARPVLAMNTSFGFFSEAALANQSGLPTTAADRERLQAPANVAIELPPRLFERSARLAQGALRMIDEITGYWPDAGEAGLGRIRARQRVNPRAWYFKAHFFQDPVQPGSLGLEALLQLLQSYMLLRGLDRDVRNPRFEPIALGEPLTWKYRGQVLPTDEEVVTELEITRLERKAGAVLAVARGSLWVDGLRIYEVDNLAMRLVPQVEDGGSEIVLDLERASWLRDHCPTYTVPALPMMVAVDYLAAAAAAHAPGLQVVGMQDVRLHRWVVVCDPPVRLRTAATPLDHDLLEVSLLDAVIGETIATATVRIGESWPPAPDPLPALDGLQTVDDLYETGALFHGPAFRVMRRLDRSGQGAASLLDGGGGALPHGILNPAVLDGVLHGIPHSEPELWFGESVSGQVAYPHRIARLTLHGPTPRNGQVRAEVRPDGFDGGPRHAAFHAQLQTERGVWADIHFSEVLLPKGPLGRAPPAARQKFLQYREPVPGLRLSRSEGAQTRLSEEEVRSSNWLPGTLEAVYRASGDLTALTRLIAVKEHIASSLDVHPASVDVEGESARCAALPLTRFAVRVRKVGQEVSVETGGPPQLEADPVRDHWRARLGTGRWPVEDLFFALIRRFVGRVVLSDPAAFAEARGRAALFLANHQVGIESLLFAIIAGSLGGRPIVTLAKQQHRDSWLGRLIALCQDFPAVALPRVLLFFDRDDQASMLGLLGAIKAAIADEGLSLMVHAEGTRSLHCRQPVRQLSGLLLDLADAADLLIVPVRFAGGLPIAAEPDATRLEFPLGYARQDLFIGRPIPPDAVRGLPLAERKASVLEALNGLGPDLSAEAPNPPDPAFAAGIARWVEQHRLDEPRAAVLHAIEADAASARALHQLIDAIRAGRRYAERSPEGAWLARLQRWFLGES